MMSQKSTVSMRKTPSGSTSSSKTKKIKVSATNASSSVGKTTKIKSSAGMATNKLSSAAKNPYPVGASHGQTIFGVTMPRQPYT